jgi:hypothetical protein
MDEGRPGSAPLTKIELDPRGRRQAIQDDDTRFFLRSETVDQTQITAIELDRVPNIGFLLIDEVIHSFRPKEKPSTTRTMEQVVSQN